MSETNTASKWVLQSMSTAALEAYMQTTEAMADEMTVTNRQRVRLELETRGIFL